RCDGIGPGDEAVFTANGDVGQGHVPDVRKGRREVDDVAGIGGSAPIFVVVAERRHREGEVRVVVDRNVGGIRAAGALGRRNRHGVVDIVVRSAVDIAAIVDVGLLRVVDGRVGPGLADVENVVAVRPCAAV